MNKLIPILGTILLISACATRPAIIGQQTIPVNKPIYVVPVPPAMPEIELYVDSLTMDDITDPGKVGQAYKHDTIVLRNVIRIQSLIIDEYRKASQNFDAVKKDIADMKK